MRKHTLATSLGVTALLITVGATGTTAYAGGVSHHDQKAKSIKVRVKDAKGDVTSKTGAPRDLATSGASPIPFKPGHGTSVTPSAGDRAVDLASVAYKLVRTGKEPALTISYTAAGPLAFSQHMTALSGTESLDIFDTSFGRGYDVTIANDQAHDIAMTDKKGSLLHCRGLAGAIPQSGHVVTVKVPLSCLAQTHLATARLQSESAHLEADAETDLSDQTEKVSIGWDLTAKTRPLPLTPLAK